MPKLTAAQLRRQLKEGDLRAAQEQLAATQERAALAEKSAKGAWQFGKAMMRSPSR